MGATSIRAIGVLVVAFILAIYLGIAAATAQFEAIAWVLGGLALVTCIGMGTRIWMLIPISAALTISFPWLPGNMDISLLGITAAVGFGGLMWLARKLYWIPRMGLLEILLILFIAMVFQAYARNPTGLNIFGSGQIGGRAYVEIAISLVGCLMLLGLAVNPKQLITAARLSIFGGILTAGVGVAAFLSPRIAMFTGPWLGAWGQMGFLDQNAARLENLDEGAADRRAPFRDMGTRLTNLIIYKVNPLLCCIHPLWVLIGAVAIGCILMSGFRSVLAGVGFALVLATYYRGGMKAVLLGCVIGFLGIAGVAVVNTFAPLPPNVQRSLSWLPGTWDERYAREGDESTEWRIEMWKAALLTDRYIDNKMLGDGLGISRREHAAQQHFEAMGVVRGSGGMDAQREYMLMVGDYHSGPVHTIRTIGYLGLILVWVIMIVIAVRAHRLIRRAKGSPWFNVCCLFCIPMVWHPLYFTLVFGYFRTDMMVLLLHVGMLRMMENTLLPELAAARQLEKQQAAPEAAPALPAPGMAYAKGLPAAQR